MTPAPVHRHVPPNRFGRDFVIGDLHGHRAALQQALEARHFIPGRDRLFSVGDLVDRGPDSVGCTALLRERWFHAVRGNHEDLLLRSVGGAEPRITELWRENGGDWGLDRKRPNTAALMAALLLSDLPLSMTVHHRSGLRFGLCHAQCPVRNWADIESAALDPDLARQMLWSRDRIWRDDVPPVAGIDLTLHGHTVVNAPRLTGNALFIETGVFRSGGRLTLLCLDEITVREGVVRFPAS
jgi:serine/threonine protein phosphatase 1